LNYEEYIKTYFFFFAGISINNERPAAKLPCGNHSPVRRRVMFNFAKCWAKRLSLRPSRSEAPASHTKQSFVFRATEVEPLPNAGARLKLRYSKQGGILGLRVKPAMTENF
jgi:hypothetical protein